MYCRLCIHLPHDLQHGIIHYLQTHEKTSYKLMSATVNIGTSDKANVSGILNIHIITHFNEKNISHTTHKCPARPFLSFSTPIRPRNDPSSRVSIIRLKLLSKRNRVYTVATRILVKYLYILTHSTIPLSTRTRQTSIVASMKLWIVLFSNTDKKFISDIVKHGFVEVIKRKPAITLSHQ